MDRHRRTIEKEYLYHVNIDSERKMEGTTIMDYPLKQLYGIRVIDDNEEFVFLESETGITERLVICQRFKFMKNLVKNGMC